MADDCHSVRTLLPRVMRGLPLRRQRDQIGHHLACCTMCRSEWAAVRETDRLVRFMETIGERTVRYPTLRALRDWEWNHPTTARVTAVVTLFVASLALGGAWYQARRTAAPPNDTHATDLSTRGTERLQTGSPRPPQEASVQILVPDLSASRSQIEHWVETLPGTLAEGRPRNDLIIRADVSAARYRAVLHEMKRLGVLDYVIEVPSDNRPAHAPNATVVRLNIRVHQNHAGLTTGL